MKRTFVWIVLFVLIFQGAMGVITYAEELLDDEGFPYPSGEPDATPPPELNATKASAASLTPVNLNLWRAESYSQVSGFPEASWSFGTSWARETDNGQPTLFYSDFPALCTALEVDVYIDTESDDDYIGLAVGFQPGDTSNTSADYLLIDWKRLNQLYDFGEPSCTPESLAYKGLAASHVFGVPTADEFWGHRNFDDWCSDLDNGLQELARAMNLGDVGWGQKTLIHFRFEYTPTSLKVYVNGVLELDLTGTFGEGRWAFYDFSQPWTYFGSPKVETLCIPVDIDIKPGSYPSSINLGNKGVTPVAIHTTSIADGESQDFDATTVDPLSVRLEGCGPPDHWEAYDCDELPNPFYGNPLFPDEPEMIGDGDIDLVLYFDTTALADEECLEVGDVEATLTGETFDGIPIKGTGDVRIVKGPKT